MSYMFYGCGTLESLDLSNFNTSNVKDIFGMFQGCNNLISLNLSNFDTSNVINMRNMFDDCKALSELDLSNFNTPNVKNMIGMFDDCHKLTSLDLSSFNIANVENIHHMFSNCRFLTSLDLSIFNTSKVTKMNNIFTNCYNLRYLNLDNFDISHIQDFSGMFENCYSLISLNLSNFNFNTKVNLKMSKMFSGCESLIKIYFPNDNQLKISNLDYMFHGCKSLTSLNLSNLIVNSNANISYLFYGCENLEYINIKNFNEIQFQKYINIFNKVPDNIVICVSNVNYNIISQLLNNSCFNIDCSYNWKLNQKKIIEENGSCLNNCNDNPLYKYEYNGKCYQNCPNGYLIDDNLIQTNKCKCELDKCLICPSIALNKSLCSKCNENYYQKENDDTNIGEYINCYKNPKGYYLDKIDKIYKECFYRCDKCELKGDNINNKCTSCNSNFSFGIKNYNDNYFNCYERCDYYYYFDEIDNYRCTIDNSCPKEYQTIIRNNTECINNGYNYILKEISKIEKRNEIEYYNKIMEIFDNSLNYENYNTSNIDNGADEIFDKGKVTFTFTTIENQKNNINNNMTIIYLGNCDISLRKYYNKSNNETLYIKKLDILQEKMNAIKVKFDIYFKSDENKFEKVDLSICKDNEISISIPIKISEPLDKLNSSSGYYNDICYPTTSDCGTDISLQDRRKEFIDYNKTICQEDCIFSEYDYNTQRAKCSCKVKGLLPSFNDIKINKKKLLENFKDIKNIANLNILICYKKLFSKKGLFPNFGGLLISLIIIFHIISILIFFLKQILILIKKIDDIIYAIKNYKLIKKEGELVNKEKKSDNQNNIRNINNNSNNLIKKIKKKKKKYKKKIIINNNSNNIILNANESDSKNKITQNINIEKENINSKNKKRNEKIEMVKNIMKYKDDEINDLTYDLALQYDKRNFYQYYISLIKTKHDLISSFCNNNDYNSSLMKINLFIIGFTMEYTMNALFYNDDTMHNIYVNQGSFDIEYELPKIIYSSLISFILNTIIKLLALSNDSIIEFKQNKTRKGVNKRGKDLKYKLKIKFILYFILSFLLLLFFWYYISMFGAIYRNTQYYLIKDTLLSFLASLIYPFFICLIPAFIRIPSLSEPNKQRKYLYKLSKMILAF